MAYEDFVVFFFDSNQRIANFSNPVVLVWVLAYVRHLSIHGERSHHVGGNILIRRLAERIPQVVGSRISIRMSFQVSGNTFEKGFVTEIYRYHANDGTALQIGNFVEDLIDLKSILDRYFDGMRGAECIEFSRRFRGFSLDII